MPPDSLFPRNVQPYVEERLTFQKPEIAVRPWAAEFERTRMCVQSISFPTKSFTPCFRDGERLGISMIGPGHGSDSDDSGSYFNVLVLKMTKQVKTVRAKKGSNEYLFDFSRTLLCLASKIRAEPHSLND